MNNLLKGLLAVVGIGGVYYYAKSRKEKKEKEINLKKEQNKKITLNDFPTYAEYENDVRFKKGENLELLVVSNGIVEDSFSSKFKSEKQLNSWIEILNDEQENVFTKENKKRTRKWLVTNTEIEEEARELGIKTISEKLKYFKEEIYEQMRDMTRDEFARRNKEYIPSEYFKRQEYKDKYANRRRPKTK